jgi:hypothetical protein
MVEAPEYVALKQLGVEIEGDYVDVADVSAWLEKYNGSKRLLFLSDNALDYIGRKGTRMHPLRALVLNTDDNEFLVAAKKAYFASCWFRKKPLEEREKLAELIGVPDGIVVDAEVCENEACD